jgi:tetratricopeptide (TPR) repeat protein
MPLFPSTSRCVVRALVVAAILSGSLQLTAQATPPSQSSSSSSSGSNSSQQEPGAAADNLNQAVHNERVWSNDPNAKRDTGSQRLRAGSATGTGTTLESNEAVFTVMAALNACGYDAGLDHANAIRLRVRREMAEEVAASDDAKAAHDKLCAFVHAHDLGDPAKTIGQYLSLALVMQPTADLELTVPIPQLPPDATQVAGMMPTLKAFANAARLHVLWVEERNAYEAAMAPLREPLTKEILRQGVYLRETAVGNADRQFLVILEPMLANGLVTARVYGLDYLMVLAPPQDDAEVRRFQDDVRHFYLDFSIEPLIFGYPNAMERLQPLLRSVAEAPLDEVYRDDVEALVSECMIRAIEARTMDTGLTQQKRAGERFTGDQARAGVALQQQAEAIRVARVQRDMQQGFILTKYFYEQLGVYEKSTESLRDAIGGMVYGMDVDMMRRQASHIQFVSAPGVNPADVAARSNGLRQRPASLAKETGTAADPLAKAAESLGNGDTAGALAAAQVALDKKQGDAGQAVFLMAQAHAMQGDMADAEQNFSRALTLTKDPHTLAWSHIYLGRIDDIKQERSAALTQYKAALDVKSGLPDAVAAAQHGMQEPYTVPKRQPSPGDSGAAQNKDDD